MRTFAKKESQTQVRLNPTKPALNHHEHPVLHLQRAMGNQAAQRLLKISTRGAAYEQEADRVAGRIMHMPEPLLQRACACGGACPTCKGSLQGEEAGHLQTTRVQPALSRTTA